MEYGYDGQGRMATLRTWRDTTNGVDAVTTWAYNNRGLLKNKGYEGAPGPDYTYTTGGRLYEREWVRTKNGSRVTSTYSYNDAGAEKAVNIGVVKVEQFRCVDLSDTPAESLFENSQSKGCWFFRKAIRCSYEGKV